MSDNPDYTSGPSASPQTEAPEPATPDGEADLDELVSNTPHGERLKLSEEPTPADNTPPDTAELDGLITSTPHGERLKLRKDAAPPPTDDSTMDDLFSAAGSDEDADEDDKARPHSDIDAAEAPDDQVNEDQPPSSMESLLQMWTHLFMASDNSSVDVSGGDLQTSSDPRSRFALRTKEASLIRAAVMEALMTFSSRIALGDRDADGSETAAGGDLLLSADRTSRMQLRERPAGVAEESPLQGLMHFSRETPDDDAPVPAVSTMDSLFLQLETETRSELEDAAPPSSMDLILDKLAEENRDKDPRSQVQAPSTMSDIYHTEERLQVRKKTLRRYQMSDDMSRLLSGAEAPRMPLPKRTSRRQRAPEPDGMTPMKPDLETVFGELDEQQCCPKSGITPRVIGETIHERLDFRYNRFRRLEIRRPVYDCPGCPGADQIVANRPLFWCREAPIGNGLLAMLATTRYFHRLPLDQLTPMLDQLGAPIPSTMLLSELNRAGEALAPLVALMKKGARNEEAPLTALVTGAVRDTPGSVRVYTGDGHVVFTFVAGEVRKMDANRMQGPQALQRWRMKGNRGRWAQIRQRFFSALLTDPVRARAALHTIQKLPPDPSTDANDLRALQTWVDAAYATIDAPRTRYQHAVTALKAMWPMLTTPDPKARAQVTDTWVFESSDGDVHQALCWLSLIESCALQGLQPWTYLFRLLEALASQPDLDLRDWTPEAVARRS